MMKCDINMLYLFYLHDYSLLNMNGDIIPSLQDLSTILKSICPTF